MNVVTLARRNIIQNFGIYSKVVKSQTLLNRVEYINISYFCPISNLTTDLTSKYNKNENISGIIAKRWCSGKSIPPANKLPQLMEFPQIAWPSLLKTIRNFVLVTFIIKPYFDREFTLPDFVAGSKKAVEVISHKLSLGDLKSIEGLVTNDIIPTLEKAVSAMSLTQREELAINVDDIYFSFPYQVGIFFDEGEKDQKRFVEITMVYHCLRGLGDMRSRGEEPPLNMGLLPEYQARISICNYRFIKEFTKGVEGDWTVNLLNHFKPVDDGK